MSAATRRPATRRRYDEAASVGARLIVAAALGETVKLDDLNPVREVAEPDPELARTLARVRERSDRAGRAVLGLDVR